MHKLEDIFNEIDLTKELFPYLKYDNITYWSNFWNNEEYKWKEYLDESNILLIKKIFNTLSKGDNKYRSVRISFYKYEITNLDYGIDDFGDLAIYLFFNNRKAHNYLISDSKIYILNSNYGLYFIAIYPTNDYSIYKINMDKINNDTLNKIKMELTL